VAIDSNLLKLLVCPRHRTPLFEAGSSLRCEEGHQYPVVDDIPVLLDNGPQTLWVAERSLKEALRSTRGAADPYFLETIGISESERNDLKKRLREQSDGFVDPCVSFLIGATNGIAYQNLIGKLPDYPIPELRLPPANGQFLLDIGCNWGRWCIAAARLGYTPIGIDPSLGSILAARRVAAQLGLNAKFVVGDARFLPFRKESMDVVFSYSVLQHFSDDDAISTVKEIGRVLRTNGRSVIQMPTVLGMRCIYHQARRRLRKARYFEVRYWSVPALRRTFAEHVGPTTFSVDCFFGIGLQAADLMLMPSRLRVAIRASEVLRKISRRFPWLCYVADSIYVESVRVQVRV
jgi:SAM-dependent methyltransferase